MIEEAIVDAYGETEQVTGWFTAIEENLDVPFETTVLGVPVTVERVDLNRSDQMVAVCRARPRATVGSDPRFAAADAATRGCGVDRGVSTVGG